jgi:outer membrane protein assembly factor BamA
MRGLLAAARAHPPRWLATALYCAALWVGTARADGPPPRIVDVRVSGARAVGAADLRAEWRALVGAPAEAAPLAAAADRTLARLARAGHLDAVCRLRLAPAAEPGAAVLHVDIEEGPATPVGAVAIDGARAIPESEARRLLAPPTGAAFDPERFESGALALLSRYEAAGYPFARVSPRDFASGAALDFRVAIDEGPLGRLLGLSVSGNASTREAFIAREMRLRPGQAWNRRALDRGRDRLLRTGLFRGVGDPYPLVDAGGGLRVGLLVKEAPANRIEGVFGWNRGDGAEEGFFSGHLDALFRNLGGVGRRAAARWERRGRDAREIRLGYREPWLPLVPAALSIDVARTFRDSTYVRTEIAGAVEVPVTSALALSASAAGETWSPGDRSPQIVPKSRRARVGLGARLDATDYPPNPSRGVNAALFGETATKRVDPIASDAAADTATGVGAAGATVRFRERLVRAALDLFVPLGGPHLVALRARGEGVSSDEEPIPEYELVFLGGARSLRGYDEDRFLGEQVGAVTVEYRFRLGGRSRLFAFVDQGYVMRRLARGDGTLERAAATPLGWGGGLQAESRVGVVGIGVGVPESEGLDAARVHVSLEQEF